MAELNKSENKKEYNEKLIKLKNKYQNRLKTALTDAREKFRFSVSQLLIAEAENSAELSDTNNDAIEIDNSIDLEKRKSELIEMGISSVIFFLRQEINKILLEYAKELIILSIAFGEKPDNKASGSFQVDKSEFGIKNEDLKIDSLKSDSKIGCIAIFCPNISKDIN